MPASPPAAWARLVLSPGIGSRHAHTLLSNFGSPERVLEASPTTVAGLVGAVVAEGLAQGPDPAALERTLSWMEEPGHHFLTWDDVEYPSSLLQIPDPPPALFFVGRREFLQTPGLAVVGSRNATAQGQENARSFARALSQAGLTIVSGLALGIDAAAHWGGLEGAGSSLAVLGTGIDRVYPARHRSLAHRLAEAGGLLSEFPLGTPPLPANFPRRNRLISGLARGCLVVEATLNSGSLITARLALEQGREVFAIPGSIHSPFSKGPHRLLREGAKLVETAHDVLEELRLAPKLEPSRNKVPATDQPCSEFDRLLSALGDDPVAIDSLSERLQLPVDHLSAQLLELELRGQLQVLPGGRYQRIRRAPTP